MSIDAIAGDIEMILPFEEEVIEETSKTKALNLARECFASFETFLADKQVLTMKSGRAQAISGFIAAQNSMAERFVELQSPKMRAELESYSRAKMLETATKLMIVKGGLRQLPDGIDGLDEPTLELLRELAAECMPVFMDQATPSTSSSSSSWDLGSIDERIKEIATKLFSKFDAMLDRKIGAHGERLNRVMVVNSFLRNNRRLITRAKKFMTASELVEFKRVPARFRVQLLGKAFLLMGASLKNGGNPFTGHPVKDEILKGFRRDIIDAFDTSSSSTDS